MTKATKFHFSVLDQKNAKSNKEGREKNTLKKNTHRAYFWKS